MISMMMTVTDKKRFDHKRLIFLEFLSAATVTVKFGTHSLSPLGLGFPSLFLSTFRIYSYLYHWTDMRI